MSWNAKHWLKLALCLILVAVGCFQCSPRKEKAESALSPGLTERILGVEEGLAPAYVLKGVNDGEPRGRIKERMRHWHVPGVSVAVMNDGVIEWARGYGEVEAGGSAADSETAFQTGSLGKTLTAVTVLALVDRGVLELDRDVNGYLASWRIPETDIAEGEPVTLERILNHSAGLTVHGFAGYAPGEQLPTLRQMLAGEPPCNSGEVTIQWKPGTEWHYSGGGYLVAQQVVEDVTGRPFSDVVDELVLRPLGMKRTFYRAQLDEESLRTAASGHQADGSIMNEGYRAMPEYGAGGGLWSTPSDLMKLGLAIMRAQAGEQGEPIAPETARNMLKVRFGGYGLGIFVRGSDAEFEFSHGGDNTGFHSYLIVFPELDQGAAIMTNGELGTPLYIEILHAIADAYEWPNLRPIHSDVVDVDPARLNDLAGSYEVAGIGQLPLTIHNGGLHVPDILRSGELIRLYPLDSLTFVDPVYGWRFAFERDPSTGVWKADVTWGVYHLSAIKTEQ